MNSVVFFGFLVADISAFIFPGTSFHLPDELLISNSVAKNIKAVSRSIKDAELDPLYINKTQISMGLPVSVLFNCEAFAENILSTGLSNIVTHKVSYSFLTSRFNFDIELPLIDFSVGAASIEAMLFSNPLNVKASGKVEIQRVRIVGEVRVNIGVFSGITIHRVIINFSLGNITSDIKLAIQGIDYSAKVNKFIGSTVPDTITAHYAEINELLEIVLKDLINTHLP